LRILVWGTYDISKPRVRLLLDGLRDKGVIVAEEHADIWKDIRDKGMLSRGQLARAALRWLTAMPRLIKRYLSSPDHDVVLVPYLGLFDVMVLAPFCKWRRKPIAWDIFISGYDTVINDRQLLHRTHPLALALYACEWCVSRIVACPFLDTDAHAARFEVLMHLPAGRVGSVPLGTDVTRFTPSSTPRPIHRPLRVFFYGQYIPLHGLETVIRAADLLARSGTEVQWELAGAGQELDRITALIASLNVTSVRQLGWVSPSSLPDRMRKADVGLGIFGTSGKALTVVPNKVYEMSAAQLPIVSADTAAMARFAQGHPWIRLVPGGSPDALASCIRAIASQTEWGDSRPMPIVGSSEVASSLLAMLSDRNSAATEG
jgi:glycosyltransferase involved in cell wall biosynthesis